MRWRTPKLVLPTTESILIRADRVGLGLYRRGLLYNGGMNVLALFRYARVLLLLLLCAACMPVASIALGESSPEFVSPLLGVESVKYDGDTTQNELPPLAPGATRLYTTQIALPTYPMEAYQSVAVDPVYHWPYLHFDRQRFLAEAPPPQTRYYELLVLENAYL